ncbi:MAG TPA: metallophosphoesterase [Candidatus Moranbacteria bacterium]|nr:metallophosphoesterase [Candidatus Moranbacteria bacterium]HSA08176.1 metallophosphoesterase [Candidatus Moranbacteria bacterium]
MDKEKKIIGALLIFAVIASIAVYAFFNSRNPFIVAQKSATDTLTADNLTAEAPEIVENDAEKLTVQEEIEEIKEEAKTENTEPTAAETDEEKSIKNEAAGDLSSKLPAYVPIARNSDELTIGFITDLHVFNGASANKLAEPFTNRIYYFVKKMNNEIVPDFMLINGDVVEGTKIPANTSIKQLQLVKNIFNFSKIQKYWVPGNHDLRSVTKQQWESALGINYLRKSFELRNYKIIILDSNFTEKDNNVSPGNGYTRGHVSREEIKWLEKELKNTDKKTIIFIHHPPLSNVDFKSDLKLLDNATELRELFAKYAVLAVFGGHVEDLYSEKVDGVQYFSIPGIYKNPKYPGAFSVINIRKNQVEVNLSYLEDGNNYKTITLEKY